MEKERGLNKEAMEKLEQKEIELKKLRDKETWLMMKL